MVSPDFCLFSLHFTNTGSDVFTFSAIFVGESEWTQHSLDVKGGYSVFFKDVIEVTVFFFYCSLDGLDEWLQCFIKKKTCWRNEMQVYFLWVFLYNFCILVDIEIDCLKRLYSQEKQLNREFWGESFVLIIWWQHLK